jgi:hypothetical protein
VVDELPCLFYLFARLRLAVVVRLEVAELMALFVAVVPALV